jgi:hypothetical protein
MKPPSKRVKKTKSGPIEKAQELTEITSNDGVEIRVDLNEALTILSSVVKNITNRYHSSNVEIVQALVVSKLCICNVERELRTRNLCPITCGQLASMIADRMQYNL